MTIGRDDFSKSETVTVAAIEGGGAQRVEGRETIAAITSPWSNGQTEGQITKLKLVKRQIYCREQIDLLQASVVGARQAASPPKSRQGLSSMPKHILVQIFDTRWMA